MEKKLRGRYTQEFEYFGIKCKAHIREYATFWEGEIDEKNTFKVYKHRRKGQQRSWADGPRAIVFIRHHFAGIYNKSYKFR